MAHVIHITGSNRSDNSLVLSDRGNTEASHGTKVTWKIRDQDVRSIRIIPKAGADDIWDTDPHAENAQPQSDWSGTTISNVRVRKKYAYSIEWTSVSGTTHTYDPIISMRPSGFDPHLTAALIVAGVAMTAMLAILLLGSKKNRKIIR